MFLAEISWPRVSRFRRFWGKKWDWWIPLLITSYSNSSMLEVVGCFFGTQPLDFPMIFDKMMVREGGRKSSNSFGDSVPNTQYWYILPTMYHEKSTIHVGKYAHSHWVFGFWISEFPTDFLSKKKHSPCWRSAPFWRNEHVFVGKLMRENFFANLRSCGDFCWLTPSIWYIIYLLLMIFQCIFIYIYIDICFEGI